MLEDLQLGYQLGYLVTLLVHASLVPLRGAIFTGFLTLGGLLLTSLSFVTTRIHDLMKSKAFERRADWLVELEPDVALAGTLRESSNATIRAVKYCFGTSLYQLVFGGLDTFVFNWVGIALVLVTMAMVARLAARSVSEYVRWLDAFERDMIAEAQVRVEDHKRSERKRLLG